MNYEEIENRIACLMHPQPHMSGRQINRFHGEQRRRIEDVAREIADRIEQLEAALEPFARHADFYKPEVPHYEFVRIPLDFLRHARAALRDAPNLGVCPVCGGDCGSANPPVLYCPMRDDASRNRVKSEAKS